MDDTEWMGGLGPEQDLMFPAHPDDPEMRESTSFWLFEKNGAFAFPRFGIEAEAAKWDNRMFQFNGALQGGTVLNGASVGPAHDPLDDEGKPTILGAGPLETRCIEPFRRWAIHYNGDALIGSHKLQLETKLAGAERIPIELVAEIEMAAPAWVHDYRPDKVALMSEAEKAEAQYMGFGYRIEQLFRGSGKLTFQGETRDFECLGSRIHRQSVRPLAGFRGHCWQSAVFPDGRAFAYIAYPPADDGSTPFNDGYVYVDGVWHKARAKSPPWLRQIRYDGDDCSVTMETDAGDFEITASTAMATFRIDNPDIGGLDLQQAAVWYEWDGQRAMGMMERSSHESLTHIVD